MRYRSEIHGSCGSALVITLLLVVLLTAMTVEFAYDVYIDTSALSNWKDAQQASLLAKSGIVLASRYLDMAKGAEYTAPEIEIPVTGYLSEGSSLVIRVEDENAKFNINTIIIPRSPRGTSYLYLEPGKMIDKRAMSTFKGLLEFLNLDPSIAYVIADWIDSDSDPRLSGTEEEAKNRYLWSVEELGQIKGIGPEIYASLRPYVTVYTPYGNTRININRAPLPVLVGLLKGLNSYKDIEITQAQAEGLARKIIDYRESLPFSSRAEVSRIAGIGGTALEIPLKDGVTVSSSAFRVTARATVNGIRRDIECVMDGSAEVLYWVEG